MSRIGKLPVPIPAGVKVLKEGGSTLRVEGPKGKLSFTFRPEIGIVVDTQNGQVRIQRPSDSKEHRALHGTTRALINNMIRGVVDPYEKKLEISGVGYSAKVEGKNLVLQIGFAHPVKLEIPQGVQVECPKPTEIYIRGADKQLVGEFAATTRRVRPPEPYNAKGIKYGKAKDSIEEVVKRKVGKAFGSGEK